MHNESMRKYWLITLVLWTVGYPAAASVPNGWAAFQRGDHASAVREFTKAAELGDADAQYNLGVMHVTGQGVPRDVVEAVKWFRMAAATGDAPAQFYLAYIYASGDGVPQNSEKAAKFYLLAARQGHAKAQYNLGRMHYIGQGLPQDYVQAYKWFALAARKGVVNAVRGLEIIAPKMLDEDIDRAHRLVRAWARQEP